jgi:hypothetical protein
MQNDLRTARCWLAAAMLLACAPLLASPNLNSGLPPKTQITKLGDEIFLNGIPTEMIGIAVPESIKNTSAFFANKWIAEGWRVNIERNGDLIVVMSSNDRLQRVATLNKTGDNTTEGSLSLTDLPQRLKDGGGPSVPVGEHLIKPMNTMVLNEVRIRDQQGESIMTTLANNFDVEQNAAFYRERMVEQGWKETRHKTVVEGKGVIVVFTKPGKEATFTMVRQSRQSFVTVNWINR